MSFGNYVKEVSVKIRKVSVTFIYFLELERIYDVANNFNFVTSQAWELRKQTIKKTIWILITIKYDNSSLELIAFIHSFKLS